MADFDKVIPPGQEGEIKVTIYGNKISTGRFSKKYTVMTNDPENSKVVLAVSGNIKRVFEISKGLSMFGFADEQLNAGVTVVNVLDTPVRITGYEWAEKSRNMGDRVEVKIKEVEKGKKYKLDVWAKDNLAPGSYFGEIVLQTDFEAVKEKVVKVTLRISPEVDVNPKTLHFMEMSVPEGTSKSFDKVFRVIANRGDTLKVLDVIPDREDISVSMKEVEPGKIYRGTVRIRPPTSLGKYSGSLKILTNYPGYEELTVAIRGNIRIAKRK